jgi:purine-binding chemotaxis protein CheW
LDTRSNDAALAGEYLTFCLGQEEYAIDILRVQEIRSYEDPTRIVGGPFFMKGVINLRGVIVPIIDLRLKLGCDEAQYTGFTVVIVLNIGGKVVGAVVDSVQDVVQMSTQDIRPAPEMDTIVDRGVITGLGKISRSDVEKMLILIDIERLIGDIIGA